MINSGYGYKEDLISYHFTFQLSGLQESESFDYTGTVLRPFLASRELKSLSLFWNTPVGSFKTLATNP